MPLLICHRVCAWALGPRTVSLGLAIRAPNSCLAPPGLPGVQAASTSRTPTLPREWFQSGPQVAEPPARSTGQRGWRGEVLQGKSCPPTSFREGGPHGSGRGLIPSWGSEIKGACIPENQKAGGAGL